MLPIRHKIVCQNASTLPLLINVLISLKGRTISFSDCYRISLNDAMYFSIFIIVIRFDLVRKLGQGTYGKVQLGVNKETGQEVAIKTIKKAKIETEADLIRIRREIQIMSSVRHPNIIHIYEGKSNFTPTIL